MGLTKPSSASPFGVSARDLNSKARNVPPSERASRQDSRSVTPVASPHPNSKRWVLGFTSSAKTLESKKPDSTTPFRSPGSNNLGAGWCWEFAVLLGMRYLGPVEVEYRRLPSSSYRPEIGWRLEGLSKCQVDAAGDLM
ncbi:hypothetical protein M407DRAFT_7211 [Tulasnella calospora MUT 4182]|uniref:Uncharacterized protein n=1 Tax=Tulasnella calospora MUT 4182 TaxID=1051891 RepID=A0A0C3QAW8_9AGAM|nr:hypothetical protein M407DRAFT_7211 [Tulasnella calospora MUT 4182]